MENASQEHEWFLARDGHRYGPIPAQELQNLIAGGQLKPEDLVWRKGFEQWVEASTVPELFIEQQQGHSHISENQNQFHAENSYINETELKAEPIFEQQFMDDDKAQIERDTLINPPPKPRKSFARRFFSFIFFLLILGGIAVFALPAVIPADFIREHIARIIKEQTGRTLTVRGKSTFSIVPYIGVRMKEASISNPPGMSGDPVVQAETFEIQLKFWPLLEQKIEVERILLKKPHIALKIDGRGTNNWVFAKNLNQKEKVAKSNFSKPVIAGFFSGPSDEMSYDTILKNINLREIQFDDGKVSYYNEKTGFSEKYEQIKGKVILPSTSKSLFATGKGLLRSKEVSFSFTLNSPNALMKGEKVPYTLDLKSKLFLTLLTGEVSWAGGIYLTGKSNELQVRSLRKLASWLNHDIAPGSGMESFNIIGDFTAQSERVEITNATITLDDTSAHGQASVTLSGNRPYVTAQLTSEAVYLSPYFQEVPINKSSFNQSNFRFAEQGSPDTVDETGSFRQVNQASSDFNNGEIIDNSQSEDSHLSAKPINTFASSLKVFDADIQFQTKKILFEKLRIGPSQFFLKIRKGDLNTKISKMDFYSGSVAGQINVSGEGPLPKFTTNLKVSDVSAGDLINSLYGFGWISGTANMDLKLSSTGHSKKQIISELNGKSVITFESGALEGVDIPANLKVLQKVISQSLETDSTQRTPFETLKATFNFNRGVATNKGLQLTSKDLQLKGQGTIDFTRGEIDYKIDTSILKNGAKKKKAAVPVRIKGPLEAPQIKIDVKETLAKNKEVFVKRLNSASIKENNSTKQKAIEPVTPSQTRNFEDMIKGILSDN